MANAQPGLYCIIITAVCSVGGTEVVTSLYCYLMPTNVINHKRKLFEPEKCRIDCVSSSLMSQVNDVIQICSHTCLARTYNFQCCFFYNPCFRQCFYLDIFPALISLCVGVFAAATLDLLHSGDDVRAGREV